MIEYRVVARCGDKTRAKTVTDLAVPQKGDVVYFGENIGEIPVDDTVSESGNYVVTVTVHSEVFVQLTMVNGWSAVE